MTLEDRSQYRATQAAHSHYGSAPAEAVNAAQLAYIALRAEREYKSPHEYAEAMLEAAAPHLLAADRMQP